MLRTHQQNYSFRSRRDCRTNANSRTRTEANKTKKYESRKAEEIVTLSTAKPKLKTKNIVVFVQTLFNVSKVEVNRMKLAILHVWNEIQYPRMARSTLKSHPLIIIFFIEIKVIYSWFLREDITPYMCYDFIKGPLQIFSLCYIILFRNRMLHAAYVENRRELLRVFLESIEGN